MKFLQNLISARKLCLIQGIVSLAIMLAIVMMSFGTIFAVEVETEGDTLERFDALIEKFTDGEQVEIPKTIEFSAAGILSSLSSVPQVAQVAIEAVKAASDAAEEIGDAEAVAESTASPIADREGLAKLVAVVVILAKAFEESIILGFVYFMLIGMTLVLPFALAISFIVSLVVALARVKQPEAAYPSISERLGSMFGSFMALLLFGMLAPGIALGSAVARSVALCAVGFVLNVVASRMKPMTDRQIKLLNINQIASLVGVGAFMTFFSSLTSTHLFDRIWDRFGAFAMEKAGRDGVPSLLIHMLMLIALIAMLLSICSYLQRVLCRMACMLKPRKESAYDSYIASAACSLLVVIIPVVLMRGDYGLVLGAEEMGAFRIYAVGVVLMLTVEIAYAVLKKTLCKGLTHDEIRGVLSGVPVASSAEDEINNEESLNLQ